MATAWVVIEENSEVCPTSIPCTTAGEQVCRGADLYVCQDGQYVLSQQNSPTCAEPAVEEGLPIVPLLLAGALVAVMVVM